MARQPATLLMAQDRVGDGAEHFEDAGDALALLLGRQARRCRIGVRSFEKPGQGVRGVFDAGGEALEPLASQVAERPAASPS